MKNALWILPTLLLAASCTSDPGPAAQSATRAEIRVMGVGGSAYKAVLVGVKDVSVQVDGKPVFVDGGQAKINLAQAGQAWTAGSFDLPLDASKVTVTLTLDDFGGYEGDIGAGALDLRSVPIQFEASVAQLLTHGKATVQLDLQRAIVPVTADTAVMLPIATIVN